MIRAMFVTLKVETVLIFLLLVVNGVNAQQVVVCKSQQSGVPREASTEWTATQFPLELTLFYNNGKTTISDRSINFIVEAEKRLELAPSEVSIVVGQGRNWASVPFAFQRAGKYVVTAYKADKSVLATTLIAIDGPENEQAPIVNTPAEPATLAQPVPSTPPASPPTREVGATASTDVQTPPSPAIKTLTPLDAEEKKTLKFEEVNIAFGTGVANKKLTDAGNSFTDAQTRKGIIVQLSLPTPFGIEAVACDIWKKSSPDAADFDELVMNQQVKVSSKAYTLQAPITLYKKGEYKVSFFTPDFVWIGSAYLTVN